MKAKINYWAVGIFYAIAVTFRYLTNKTDLLNVFPSEILKSLLTGIGPALGALAVFLIFKIKPVLSLKGNYKNFVIPFALYWLLPVLLISAVLYFLKGTVPVVSVFAVLVYGMLEEIGWRGFLYQHLKSLPLFLNIFIVTTLWFMWHLNFEVTSSNIVFFLILLVGSWGIGKVSDTTNSLLAVSAFHSLNNFLSVYDNTKNLIIIILLAVWIIHLVLRKKRLAKLNSNN